MRAWMIVPLTTLSLALTACADAGGTDKAGTDKDAGDGDSGATIDLSDVTYYADVAPMLAQHCTRCHHDGGLGPADFTDPVVVDALAPAMLAAMEDGRMPPAAADPSCRDYVGSDVLTMPNESRDIFAAWVDLDKPMGEVAEQPALPEITGELKDPDVVYSMSAPYTPAYTDDRNPGNEYRCFVIDPAENGGRYITAMAPVVDQTAIVHHVVLFSVERDSIGEEYLGDEGFDCIDGQGGDATSGMIAAWAPGMLPIEFPEGAGMQLPGDALLILQMHYFYNPSEGDVADQSGYAFKLADTVEKGVIMAPLGSYSFAIPPGDTDYSDAGSFTNTYVPLDILGVFPHMHQLGQRFDMRVEHSDGSESCVVSGDYDFDNQMTYQMVEPVELGVDDKVRFECNWNNADGANTVRVGERTDEEMCFFFTLVAP
jgi:hypothetical protein